MNTMLLKALLALAPACLLLAGSIALFVRAKHASTALQLVGAASAVLVVLTHVFEARHLFSWMHWGQEHSLGHYLDLSSAVLACTLFPVGYILGALDSRYAPRGTRPQSDGRSELDEDSGRRR